MIISSAVENALDQLEQAKQALNVVNAEVRAFIENNEWLEKENSRLYQELQHKAIPEDGVWIVKTTERSTSSYKIADLDSKEQEDEVLRTLAQFQDELAMVLLRAWKKPDVTNSAMKFAQFIIKELSRSSKIKREFKKEK